MQFSFFEKYLIKEYEIVYNVIMYDVLRFINTLHGKIK